MISICVYVFYDTIFLKYLNNMMDNNQTLFLIMYFLKKRLMTNTINILRQTEY